MKNFKSSELLIPSSQFNTIRNVIYSNQVIWATILVGVVKVEVAMKRLSLVLFIVLCSRILVAGRVMYFVQCKDGGCFSQINNLINVTDPSSGTTNECQLVGPNNWIDEECFKKTLVPFWNAKDEGISAGIHTYSITLKSVSSD